MFVLIDVRAIISKHYETLRLDSPIKFILLLFVIIPILISIFLVYLDKMLTQNSVNDLITAYTLFTGFLLSITFVLFDIEGKLKRTTYRYLEKKDLLHHLYANTLYALLISMITLVILILVAITELWTKVAQNTASRSREFIMLSGIVPISIHFSMARRSIDINFIYNIFFNYSFYNDFIHDFETPVLLSLRSYEKLGR